MTDALAAAYEKVLAERNQLQLQVNGLSHIVKLNNQMIERLRSRNEELAHRMATDGSV